MGVARVQVTLDRRSAIPADVVTNTLYFKGGDLGDVTLADATALAAAVDAFYQAIDQRLGAPLAGTGTIDVYNVADVEPRVPIYSTGIGPLTVGANSLPSEVAMVLSFRRNPVSGENAARMRGRIYLGPLITGWSVVSAPLNEPRPLTTYQDEVMAAAVANLFAPAAAPGYGHCVFSPSSYSGGAPEDAAFLVDEYWMDDAFDTQRRRGAPVTSRRFLVG